MGPVYLILKSWIEDLYHQFCLCCISLNESVQSITITDYAEKESNMGVNGGHQNHLFPVADSSSHAHYPKILHSTHIHFSRGC